MNILVVGAHPEPRSFNVALRDAVLRHFDNQGDTVVLRDLYKLQFNPVASRNDFVFENTGTYLNYALAQRSAWESNTLSPDIENEARLLLDADLLILVFPLYWFSLPAILKGWIDRVFLSGVMYGGRRFYDRGPMAGKKALIVTTLGSREHMFGEKSVHGEFEHMIRHIQRGTLQYVGFDVYEPCIFWHVPYVNDAKRTEYLEEFRDSLLHLKTRPILSRQSLDNFDKIMQPIG